MQELQLGKLRYVIDCPDGFSSDKQYPVILFLHGAGTRGNDIQKLYTNPYFLQIEKYEQFPFDPKIPGLICGSIWKSWFWKLLTFPLWIKTPFI